jgi:hypothetical protein
MVFVYEYTASAWATPLKKRNNTASPITKTNFLHVLNSNPLKNRIKINFGINAFIILSAV